MVRLVQDARRGDGLHIGDRISLRWATPDGELAAALAQHGALISAEVLAADYGPAAGQPAGQPGHEHADADLGLRFWIEVA